MNYLPGGFDGLQMVQEDVDDTKKGAANQEQTHKVLEDQNLLTTCFEDTLVNTKHKK